MKKKEGLAKKFKRALELDELMGENDRIEMSGNSDLCVRKVLRILLYSKNEINLSLKSYILKIYGEELYCASYFGGTVRVSGEISSIEFYRREKK
jgi:sporulation protein YqfC